MTNEVENNEYFDENNNINNKNGYIEHEAKPPRKMSRNYNNTPKDLVIFF